VGFELFTCWVGLSLGTEYYNLIISQKKYKKSEPEVLIHSEILKKLFLP